MIIIADYNQYMQPKNDCDDECACDGECNCVFECRNDDDCPYGDGDDDCLTDIGPCPYSDTN